MTRYPFYLLFLMLSPLIGHAGSQDWTTQVDKQSPPASLEKLSASGNDFLGAFTAHYGHHLNGYVLLLHGANQHPAWPAVVNPLRLALPKYGWSTLSIELPELTGKANEKNLATLLDQASNHILAAQTFLQNKGAKRIVLVAYDLGARMAVDWLSKTPQSAIKAVVLISMADGEKDSEINSNTNLLKIDIPILDIVAEHDSPRVIVAASERRQYRTRMRNYRQIEIYAADQYYSQLNSELIKRVRGWLKLSFSQAKP